MARAPHYKTRSPLEDAKEYPPGLASDDVVDALGRLGPLARARLPIDPTASSVSRLSLYLLKYHILLYYVITNPVVMR